MWSEFKRSEAGNIAIMFSVVLGMLGILLGAAIDGSRLRAAQTKAATIADAAALAGASASESDIDNREEIVRAYIQANYFDLGNGIQGQEPIIHFDDENEVVTVSIPTNVDLLFGAFLNTDRKAVTAVSQATYLQNNIDPVSIAFALDVSGSMQWDTTDGLPKIDVLKTATRSLFDSIESGSEDPDKLKEALRSGMSAYNTELVSNQPMSWGWSNLENAVTTLAADGGTNSTPALENSYVQLLNDRAFRTANDRKFDIDRLKEYVIFMTDGDNNQPEFDDNSYQICMDMRADGIEIYSVAFEAPEKGELLLVDCASPNTPENAVGAGDGGKCMNNGAQGNGLALGHCKDEKSAHYFDANNAAAFEAAFKRIGEEIVKSNVRLN